LTEVILSIEEWYLMRLIATERVEDWLELRPQNLAVRGIPM
jgi:hypothetical protein